MPNGVRRDMLFRQIDEAFGLAASEGHQFLHRGEIPVRVEDFGMSEVGLYRRDLLIHVGTFRMPEHQPPDSKGVAQVMQSWRRMNTAIHPAQTVAQGVEDAVRLPFSEWRPQVVGRGY